MISSRKLQSWTPIVCTERYFLFWLEMYPSYYQGPMRISVLNYFDIPDISNWTCPKPDSSSKLFLLQSPHLSEMAHHNPVVQPKALLTHASWAPPCSLIATPYTMCHQILLTLLPNSVLNPSISPQLPSYHPISHHYHLYLDHCSSISKILLTAFKL